LFHRNLLKGNLSVGATLSEQRIAAGLGSACDFALELLGDRESIFRNTQLSRGHDDFDPGHFDLAQEVEDAHRAAGASCFQLGAGDTGTRGTPVPQLNRLLKKERRFGSAESAICARAGKIFDFNPD
jgi:hypothetical protein